MGKHNAAIEQDVADAIMERPHGFSVAGKWLYLYPVTLGKTLLLDRLVSSLHINQTLLRKSAVIETMRIVNTNRETVCRILAIHTLRTQQEIFDVEIMRKREEFLLKELADDDMATLLMLTLTNDPVDKFIKHFGIDKDRKDQSKIAKVKNSKGNSLQFGGHSLYGAMIDAACERYGWSFEYVVWCISYVNLCMVMADAITSVYLSDDERKKVRINNDRERISADDPKNWAKIKSQKWD